MTQSTEQERKEFEAWYSNSLRAERPLLAEWSDSEIRSGCMYPEGDSYKVDSAKWMWQAWQAARRAQVVPKGVPDSAEAAQWRNIKKVVNALADFCFGSKDDPKWGGAHIAITHSLIAKDGIDVLALGLEKLTAAAPQPPEAGLMSEKRTTKPEAAPVQMPEADFYGFRNDEECRVDMCFSPASPRLDGVFAMGYYSWPKVRQLLATPQAQDVQDVSSAVDALVTAAFIEGGVSAANTEAARQLTEQRKQELQAALAASAKGGA